MIIYSVNITFDKEIESEWLKWMKDVHIPNVMKTGRFNNYKIFKIIVPSEEFDKISYAIHYECESIKEYLSYSEEDAPNLRKEHIEKFNGKFLTSRLIMERV